MLHKLKYFKYYSNLLYDNWTQPKETYAQHGEDILIEKLFPKGIGSFIDIGANDGVLFSNTYKFAKIGARGLCVEPSRSAFRKLRLNHLFHKDIICLHAAISKQNGMIFLKEDGYESTLSKVTTKRSRDCTEVQSKTFDSILKKYPEFKLVDLLSVDVEGHEGEVFDGLKTENFSAKLIIIESDKSETDRLLSIDSLQNYQPLLMNEINTILVNKSYHIPIPKNIPKGFYQC